MINKYVEISKFQKFEEGIQNGNIVHEGNKFIVKRGSLVERVVSLQISKAKIDLTDKILHFIATLFSKEYREAKAILQNKLVRYIDRYENKGNPSVYNLYKQTLGERLKKYPEQPIGREKNNLKWEVYQEAKQKAQEVEKAKKSTEDNKVKVQAEIELLKDKWQKFLDEQVEVTLKIAEFKAKKQTEGVFEVEFNNAKNRLNELNNHIKNIKEQIAQLKQ